MLASVSPGRKCHLQYPPRNIPHFLNKDPEDGEIPLGNRWIREDSAYCPESARRQTGFLL